MLKNIKATINNFMKTFQEWLKLQEVNNQDYNAQVADAVKKLTKQKLGTGTVVPPHGSQQVDAKHIIQKAALDVVNPANVASALDATVKDRKKI
jgi:hypothetical protein